MNSVSDDLLKAFEFQSNACAKLGSQFSSDLLIRAKSDATSDGPVKALVMPWQKASFEEANSAAVPLRLLAAIHALVLRGDEPELSASYPPNKMGMDQVWSLVRDALRRRQTDCADFMSHEPQTNEVRRSLCLLGGFLEVAHKTQLPLRCFELGASAGLNSLWDHFHYRIGNHEWGPPSSTVKLSCEWRGVAPPIPMPVVVEGRFACDRRPVELKHRQEQLRLMAYVWPDQLDRLERLRTAITLAQQDRELLVESADAHVWAERAVPREGCATILFHSVMWQYLPTENQLRLKHVIDCLGQAATENAPFAWLRMEPGLPKFEVRLTLWPGGDERLLAVVHPHGAWVNWL
jgi:hypothetical protein